MCPLQAVQLLYNNHQLQTLETPPFSNTKNSIIRKDYLKDICMSSILVKILEVILFITYLKIQTVNVILIILCDVSTNPLLMHFGSSLSEDSTCITGIKKTFPSWDFTYSFDVPPLLGLK